MFREEDDAQFYVEWEQQTADLETIDAVQEAVHDCGVTALEIYKRWLLDKVTDDFMFWTIIYCSGITR